MRELKFQLIENGKIIGEESCKTFYNGGVWSYFLYDSDRVLHSEIYWPKGFNQLERRQYIGRKDKNGKEIYEGDIAIHAGASVLIGWDDDFGGFGLNTLSGIFLMHCGKLAEPHLEVIGNIYENKELLEGGKL